MFEQVTRLKEELGLVPGDAVRLVCAIPRALCTDEAAANVLEVAQLLRSLGVPDFALSAAVKQCPDLFTVQVTLIERKDSPVTRALCLSLALLISPWVAVGIYLGRCSTSIWVVFYVMYPADDAKA